MSSLGYSGLGSNFFESLLIPWKSEQEDRERKAKAEVQRRAQAQQAQISAAQRAEAQASEQEALRFKAITDLQAKAASKLTQLEEQAEIATGVVLKIREIATAPILTGRPVLGELDQALSDMEQAVVAIQAGTVVDLASFDTAVLAAAYSNVSAALIAMRAVTARGIGIQKDLEAKIQGFRDEEIRLQLARDAAAAERASAERRERQLAEQRQAEEASRAAEATARRRRDLMGQILAVQAELGREKRRLSEARTELGNLKFARAERARAQALSGWRR
jgi:hypothetical protein